MQCQQFLFNMYIISFFVIKSEFQHNFNIKKYIYISVQYMIKKFISSYYFFDN